MTLGSFLQKCVNRLKWLSLYPKDWVLRKVYTEPIVKDSDETVDKIISDHCSVSRYGDGEFNIIFGNQIDFQQDSVELAQIMRNILQYDANDFLVCIPKNFHDDERYIEETREFWRVFMRQHRLEIMKLLKPGKIYYDAAISRFYHRNVDKKWCEYYVPKLKKIWENRRVVMIEGEKSRLGVNNDLFDDAAEIKRILCPAEDAFKVYYEVIEYVEENIEKNTLILIALGPTATAMAFDLYKKGFQAIDIGHVDIEYEWMKMEATEKVTVKGKYTNETNDGKLVCEVYNEKYEKEIMAKIGC